MSGTPNLVLVGGGHAHVEVLRRLASRPFLGARICIVLDSPVSIYSGMVPGVVAGQYTRREVEIDVAALAKRAGASVALGRMTAIAPLSQRIEVEGAAPVRYDVASLNVGSAPAGLGLPGVARRALPVRPMGTFLEGMSGIQPIPGRVVLVGGGAGGVELAFALRRRLTGARVTLVEAGPRLLPQASTALARTVLRRLNAAAVDVICSQRAVRADDGELVLGGGERLAFDRLIWTAGARPVAALADSPLPRDARGFVRVEPTLQVAGHPELFAAGDCASPAAPLEVPRAGVYAVRQGPVLAENLIAFLGGRPLRRYRPQRDFLTLINFANGSAAGGKWGYAFEGSWVWKLKDRIDRRFVARYRA